MLFAISNALLSISARAAENFNYFMDLTNQSQASDIGSGQIFRRIFEVVQVVNKYGFVGEALWRK
jgi:hypothetical protein